jgi:hypothetical protein
VLKTSSNSIKPREHGSQVVLDPNFLLGHALYMPDGETVVRSNMTGDRSDRLRSHQDSDATLGKQMSRSEDRIYRRKIHRQFCRQPG